MYSVFNKCLLSDMGNKLVRKHLDKMNAQCIWEEFATHMTTSSKGKAEKHRLHTYVTTTVLDKSWWGRVTLSSLSSIVEFWGLQPLIPLLQCVNRLGFEVCSVNSCQSEQGSLATLI